MDKVGKRFLVHIELAGYDLQRLGQLVPKLQAVLDKMSNKNYQLGYHSVARDTFGYFIRTELAPAQIRARLTEAPGPAYVLTYEPPILSSGDRVLVLEIGAEYDAKEYKGKIDPWLRNH